MVEPEELDKLEAELDPATRLVVKLLRESTSRLQQTIDELKQMLAQRDAQLAQFQRMLFGKRSEKLPSIESEVRRVVEQDELTVEGKPMPKEPEERAHERRRTARKKSEPERQKKRKLRKDLPVVRETVDVAPEQLPEGYDRADFREVGDGEVVRRVEHVREHLVMVEYRLSTLASKDGEQIVRAVSPPGVVEGGHYGPGVYADVIVSKCDDSQPLYRIERRMARAGCPIARSTLCSFFHRGAELLAPVYRRIIEAAVNDPYLHADETRLYVQAKDECLEGWIWGFFSRRALAYVFDESRGGKVAKRILAGTRGALIIDGYAGYNGVIADDPNDVGRTRVGCWSHARRKFFEALSTEPDARIVLDWIVELYRIEHRAAERNLLGTEAHLALRDVESRVVVKQIESWLDANKSRFNPKSPMANAVGYATNARLQLSRFLDDAKLPLDNNYAERQLRIIALGRKNFLFAGHVEGAQNLAVLQSIVGTCRINGVNPYEYIKDLLIRIQTHPAREIDALLPWNWRPPPSPDNSAK